MGEDNVVRVETLYTYDAAIRRYEEERMHEWRCTRKRLENIRKEQVERRRYFLNQKLIGFFFLLASVLMAILVDLTCLVGIIPAAWLIATKKMVIVNDYWKKHGGASQYKDTDERR